jgi:hypothetical protein
MSMSEIKPSATLSTWDDLDQVEKDLSSGMRSVLYRQGS